SGKVYVVGAGLAGLSAAVALAQRGCRVEIIEATASAGGRCRSYYDPALERVIDNGNHLILSGNRAVKDYLDAIGASQRLFGPQRAEFAFVDVRSKERWVLRPNDGPVPWWIFCRNRRVPGTRATDYLALARLVRGAGDSRAAMPRAGRPVWDKLLEPVL